MRRRLRRPGTTVVLVALLALAAAGTGTALATAAPQPAPRPAAAPRAAAALTWSDDFDGPAGSAPDAGRWRHDIGGSGWGNQELEYYTNDTRNAALDGNGHLVITARRENPAGYGCWYGSCQYTSARLLTAGTFAQAYGRFEARIQIPRGQGMWPAFWMLGNNIGSVGWPNSGEIDVMENIGREPGTVHGSLHGPGYSGGNSLTAGYSLGGGQAFADGFHTYAVDWAPGSVTFSVDGNQYERRTPADTRGNPWVFDHPFFILLNVAVGGGWPGSPDGSTSFPQQMVVDYVHVSAAGSGGGTSGRITGLGGKCVDVAGANTANGTPVQLWDCNGTGAQNWTIGGDGTIRALGKCLDVSGGGTANGTVVQLWDCNGTGAQQWRVSTANDIVNPQANRCLDATGASSANGTRLQIWDCTGGANQKWTVS
jgi:beta-glucanase (GH16 family)